MTNPQDLIKLLVDNLKREHALANGEDPELFSLDHRGWCTTCDLIRDTNKWLVEATHTGQAEENTQTYSLQDAMEKKEKKDKGVCKITAEGDMARWILSLIQKSKPHSDSSEQGLID